MKTVFTFLASLFVFGGAQPSIATGMRSTTGELKPEGNP